MDCGLGMSRKALLNCQWKAAAVATVTLVYQVTKKWDGTLSMLNDAVKLQIPLACRAQLAVFEVKDKQVNATRFKRSTSRPQSHHGRC
mmetsp:Transcript_33791/g.54126  ORF Transcript_33791/g.54126 Transcript_33791/m.54126 type:complete len:88 (-) Transcript_33791:114-377(-)